MNLDEKLLSQLPLAKGRILNFQQWQVLLPNGTVAERDVIVHPGATAVLAMDAQNNVAIVRQFRTPIGRVMAEIPAGKLDKGEEPLACAKRELEEETGLQARHWQRLTHIYPVAAYSTEIIYLYLAKDLYKGQAHLDEDEFLNLEWVPLNDLYQSVVKGEIHDSKTCIAISMVWAQQHPGRA